MNLSENNLSETELENKASEDLELMFNHKSKVTKIVPPEYIKNYKNLLLFLKDLLSKGKLPMHPNNSYLGENRLAHDIYKSKYYLKNLKDELIEKRPEETFARLAAFLAAVETSKEKQEEFAVKFYNDLVEGHFLPGGRVIAGAGDLYRLKTLGNCFVSMIEDDNIESIYKAAYECARTYSYGGGIGVDMSSLRPREALVHNAANHSTGAVSFMEIYSLTTGLIGQSGRRGALMLTLDVKHPDIFHFVDIKRIPNWVTRQITDQCKWSNLFNERQLHEIERQVRENTQVRFANISMKVTDEFMSAVEEQTKYGKDKIMVYKRLKNDEPEETRQGYIHYSFGIPSKDLENYEFVETFGSVYELNNFLLNHKKEISEEDLKDIKLRNLFGDFILKLDSYDLAIHYSGDFLLYFNSDQTKEVKRLIKARELWDKFVASNYKTAEPGLIFWSRMVKYSPSNYVGRPIITTNPCVIGSSLVSTINGLEKIEELAGRSIEIATDSRVPIEVKNSDSELTLMEQKENGILFNKSPNVWFSGIKPVYKLKTRMGYEITTTQDHKIMTSNGFKELSSLTKEDKILIQKGEGKFKENKKLPFNMNFTPKNNHSYNYKFPEEWTKELGRLLGWTVGDGFITDNRLGLVFENSETEILKGIKNYMDNIYGKEGYIQDHDSTKHLIYTSKFIAEFLERLGVKKVLPQDKLVPEKLFTATKEAIIGFLQGLFTADGTVGIDKNKGNYYIRLTSKSEKLIKEVQLLLLNLGIISRIYNRSRKPENKFSYMTVKGEYKTYYSDGKLWELHLSKGSARRFLEEVGFMEDKHKEKVQEFLRHEQYKEEFYDYVNSIEFVGKEKVYDLSEPHTHSFIANGIVIHNCGEIALEDGGACNLSAMNLSRFVDGGYTENAKINWELLGESITNVTRFLDNTISWNMFMNPLEKQRRATSETRRLGLGVMGIADMLNQLGIGYDSNEGLELIGKVMKFIANTAYKASSYLALEKEPSSLFNYESYSKCPFFQESIDPDVKELVRKNGLRNIAILTIAPTGTISNVVLGFKNKEKYYVGVSSGVEPVFALYYQRRSETLNKEESSKFYNVFHPTVQAHIDLKNLNEKSQGVTDLEELRKILPDHFFRTAHFINADKRVEVQGICQKYIDHSISSTVNLPESIKPDMVSNIYFDAWKKGLKGITIYRDGSRYPILSVAQEQTEFQEVKKKTFKVFTNDQELILKGDEVFALEDGVLSTAYHSIKENHPVKIEEINFSAEKTELMGNLDTSKNTCEIKIEDGKVIKTCE